MKLRTKIVLVGWIIGAAAFVPVVFAQEGTVNTNTGTNATANTQTAADVRAENKAKMDALRAENKAKMEALRAENKAKREEMKKANEAKRAEEKAKRDGAKAEKEAATLKMMQDNFSKAITDAQSGLAAATAKLAEAKAAADAATDKATLEKARQLFAEARKLAEKAMRPMSMMRAGKQENNNENNDQKPAEERGGN